jgi:hypothetical protein
VTRRERPDLGWHAVGWGLVRRWWARRRTPEGLEPVGEHALEEPDPAPPTRRRWIRMLALCAGAVLVLAALRPAWWVALLCGAGCAGAVAWGAIADRAERMAARLHAEQAAQRRAARQRHNRIAHRTAQQERDELARIQREERRAANREVHWRGSGSP